MELAQDIQRRSRSLNCHGTYRSKVKVFGLATALSAALLSVTSLAHGDAYLSKADEIDRKRAICLEQRQDTKGTIDCLDQAMKDYRTATGEVVTVQLTVRLPFEFHQAFARCSLPETLHLTTIPDTKRCA